MIYLVLCVFLTSCCHKELDNPVFASVSACYLETKINSVLNCPEYETSDKLISELNCLIARLKCLEMRDKIAHFEALKQKLLTICLERSAILMERRIQMHFKGLSNAATEDVVTLISAAQAVVKSLKNANLMYYANKLESYIDVLMFGKKAIQSSIDDTQRLISSPLISPPPIKFNCGLPSDTPRTNCPCNNFLF